MIGGFDRQERSQDGSSVEVHAGVPGGGGAPHREQGTSVAESARRLGLGAETFRRWVRQAEVDVGERVGATREEHVEIVRLKRELRRVEEEKLILQKAAAYFARTTFQRFAVTESERDLRPSYCDAKESKAVRD